MNFKNIVARLVRDEQGQDMIEYALLAAFISIIAITAITSIGTSVNTVYGRVQTAASSAATN